MLLVATILHSYVGKPSARKKKDKKKSYKRSFSTHFSAKFSSLDALEVITRCAERVVRYSRSFSFLVEKHLFYFSLFFDAVEGSLIINQPKRQKVF